MCLASRRSSPSSWSRGEATAICSGLTSCAITAESCWCEMLGPRWVRAVGTVGFGSTHPVGTRAQSPPGSRACRRDVAVSEGRAMELSEAYEQTPAQTASQAWRYVVAQATGILMARFRIRLRDSLRETCQHGIGRTPSPRRCGTRDRRGGQQVGVSADQVYGPTTASSMRHQPTREPPAQEGDWRGFPTSGAPCLSRLSQAMS